MAFDEKGQADTFERKIEICRRAYDLLTRQVGFPAGGHHLRSEHLRDRHRHRRAQQLRGRLHQRDALDQAASAARQDFGRRVERQLFVSRQRPGARGDPHGVPVSRDSRRHDDGHRQRGPARRLRRDSSPRLRERVEDVVLNRRARRDRAAGRASPNRSRRRARQHVKTCRGATGRSRRGLSHALVKGITTLHRRGHRGGAAKVRAADPGDRRSADGRDERRRRSLRRRQDVPAAGGEERARDEAGGRPPHSRSSRRRRRDRATPASRRARS